MTPFVHRLAAVTILLAVSAAGAATTAISPQDSMDQALAALEAGQFELAAEHFGAAVEADPENGRAWHLYGYSLHAAGHLEEAIRVHQRTTTFEEFRGIGLYNLGCAHALLGHPDQALEALFASAAAGFDVAGHAPDDADLVSLHDDPRFHALLQHAGGGGGSPGMGGGDPMAQMEQLVQFVGMRVGQIIEDMSPQIESAVQEVVGIAMMHAERLMGEFQQRVESDDQLMGAIMQLQQALGPMLEQMGPMLEQLAPMLEEMGLAPPRGGMMAPSTSRAPAASAPSVAPSIDSAEALAQEERWDEAAMAYAAVLEQQPQNIAAAFGHAYSLHMSGAYEAAIAAHQYAAQFEPVQGVALYNLGCAYALTGRLAEAIEALRASAEAGFDVAGNAASDSDLESLRALDAFRSLMDELDGAKVRKLDAFDT